MYNACADAEMLQCQAERVSVHCTNGICAYLNEVIGGEIAHLFAIEPQ